MAQSYLKNVNVPNKAVTKKEKNQVLMNDEELMRDKPLIISGHSSIHRFHQNFRVLLCVYTIIYIHLYFYDELMNIVNNIIYNILNISHSSFSHQFSSKTDFDEFLEFPP